MACRALSVLVIRFQQNIQSQHFSLHKCRSPCPVLGEGRNRNRKLPIMLLAHLNHPLCFLQHPTSKVLHSTTQCTKCLSRCPLHPIPVFPRLISLRYLQWKRRRLLAPFRISLSKHGTRSRTTPKFPT